MSQFLPDDQAKELPPIPDEWFDGDKQSITIDLKACQHELYAVSSTEARCKRCTACWNGAGIAELVRASTSP